MNRKYPSSLLFIILLLLSSGLRAAVWITIIEANPDQYKVVRQGQAIAVQVYSSLQDGDRITIEANGASIQLESDDGRMFTINRGSSPYIVNGAGKAASWDENFSGWISSWFNDAPNNEQSVVTLVSKNLFKDATRIRVPALTTRIASLAAGKRDFCLQWTGGEPPFVINLTGKTKSDVIVRRTGLADYEATIPNVEFVRGSYLLEVSGRKLSTMVNINVVPSGDAPMPPDEFNDRLMSPRMRQTVNAAWLAEQHNGIWRLEAVQQLCKLNKTYPPAKAVLNLMNKQ